mgnify:CR=1 FL=1
MATKIQVSGRTAYRPSGAPKGKYFFTKAKADAWERKNGGSTSSRTSKPSGPWTGPKPPPPPAWFKADMSKLLAKARKAAKKGDVKEVERNTTKLLKHMSLLPKKEYNAVHRRMEKVLDLL